jgi:hypothetical protein
MQDERSIRVEILLVGCNPISGDVVLSRRQIQLTPTDHFVQVFFQNILKTWAFHVRDVDGAATNPQYQLPALNPSTQSGLASHAVPNHFLPLGAKASEVILQ